MFHNFTGTPSLLGSDRGKVCTMCDQVQGVNASTACPGREINVPAFTFQHDVMSYKGETMVLCGVQNAEAGTYSDLFQDPAHGRAWITDILVAYFGYSYSHAKALVTEAWYSAQRAGMVG